MGEWLNWESATIGGKWVNKPSLSWRDGYTLPDALRVCMHYCCCFHLVFKHNGMQSKWTHRPSDKASSTCQVMLPNLPHQNVTKLIGQVITKQFLCSNEIHYCELLRLGCSCENIKLRVAVLLLYVYSGYAFDIKYVLKRLPSSKNILHTKPMK